MALIKCVECGNDVSDQRLTCPFCGLPGPGASMFVPAKRKGNGGRLAGAVLFSLGLMAVIGYQVVMTRDGLSTVEGLLAAGVFFAIWIWEGMAK